MTTLFQALARSMPGVSWRSWPEGLRDRIRARSTTRGVNWQ
jgi:hypothetical protein